MHVESHLHDAVVNVGLVGVEHCLAFELAPQCYTNDIDARDEDEGEGDEEWVFVVRVEADIGVHRVFDGQIGDDVAKEEAT